MTELTETYILERKNEAVESEFEPKFSLEDLVGKTISEHRKIKNPKEYDPEKESPNPEYFDVLVFSDGTFLLTENWGDCECGHLKYYYFNGRKTLYSDQLFGVL